MPLAIITFLDREGRPVDPGYGVDAPPYPTTGPVHPGGPVDPGYGVGGGRDHIWLPVYPNFDPTKPDNTLPGGPPAYPSGGPIVPGRHFVVKYLACKGLVLVPDNSLPETPEPK